jgi:hypothetical protein
MKRHGQADGPGRAPDADAEDERKIGKLPVNLLLGAYYNVVTPKYGADW